MTTEPKVRTMTWHLVEPGLIRLGNTILTIKHITQPPKLNWWKRLWYSFHPCFVVSLNNSYTQYCNFSTLDEAKLFAERLMQQWIELGEDNGLYLKETGQ